MGRVFLGGVLLVIGWFIGLVRQVVRVGGIDGAYLAPGRTISKVAISGFK